MTHDNNSHGADVAVGLNTVFIQDRMQQLRLTPGDLGELVADLLNRRSGAFSPWTVQTWLAGKSLPDGLTVCAIAQILELDGGQVFAKKLSERERHSRKLQAQLEELDAERKRLMAEMEAAR
jgi:hypothetical protein